MNAINTDASAVTSALSHAPLTAVRGAFISFEGIDGAGKSTHIAAAAALVAAQGMTVVQSREPGGTPLSEQLRTLVLHESMDAVTESLLVFAARREHVVQRIAPALAQGQWVLCDRFTDASFAYQGGGRGLDWQMLEQLEQYAQRVVSIPVDGDSSQLSDSSASPTTQHPASVWIQPDLTLWFDVPPAVAAARLQAARTPDKFEAQQAAFFERVRAGYLRRQQAQPERMVRIDAHQAMEAVWQDVQAVLVSFMKRQAQYPRSQADGGGV